MVLDSSVMNVSISQIVADLNTTIQGVQLAITAYTLVMAAFMLVGAKLGDIWGRDRAFAVGLVVYATGSFITSISPNLTVLLFGWSLIEGLGAVLVVPAIAALVAQNYEGKERALAYGIVGGVAAAAIAAGPVIGGWVTTTWTWRLVFVGEVFIVAVILLLRKRMKSAPAEPNPPSLDIVGAALSASGLAIIVLAILQSSTWGFIQPRVVPVIAGREITPLGFSVVPFLILAGIGLLFVFEAWEQRLARLGRDRLLDSALLGIVHLRAGLATLGAQQLVLLGTFFVLPVYLQVVLGLNALETGLRLLPMSVTMLIAALTGPKIAARRSPKAVCRLGLVAISVAAVILLATLDIELNDVGFLVGLAVFGVGAGLLASQLGNVIISAAPPAQTNEAGGLQGTAQNLGASLGTALIGAILLTGLTNGFVDRITANEELPAEVRTTRCHDGERAGARSRSGRGGRAVPDGRRPPARSGRGHRDGLRRCAARRPPAGPRRGRAAGAARPVLHPQPARPVDPGGAGRGRTRSGGGTRRLTRRPPGAYTRGDGSARHRAPRVPGRAGSGRRGPRATGDALGRRRPDARFRGPRVPWRPRRALATRSAAPGAARGPGPHRLDQPAGPELRLQAADDPAGRGLRRGHVLRAVRDEAAATGRGPRVRRHRVPAGRRRDADRRRGACARSGGTALRRWRANLAPIALPRAV